MSIIIDGIISERHSDLVVKSNRAKRLCLKCRKPFISNGFGIRICANCNRGKKGR